MKILAEKKWLLLNYALMALWLAAVLIINQIMAMAPWTLTLAFFGFLAVPGFALARLLKIDQDSRFNRFIIWLTIGLVFSLVCSGFAMILGWSIFVLAWFYIIAIIVLFVTALILDLRRQIKEEPIKWSWRQVLALNNLSDLAIVLIAAVVIIGVGIQGTLFRGGDASFHLSILRKAFEGSSLSPGAMSFVHSNTIHVAYGLPVWHIFLGLLGRLSHADPYLLWKTISIPLSILTILVWYWLGKIFFKSRFVGLVGLVFLLNYVFNWNTGYLFTVLPFPDTLNNFILLPWTAGLFLQYVFTQEKSKFGDIRHLCLLVILSLLMAAIHITQYIYLLMIIVLFGIIWTAVFWKNEDYKSILRKTFYALAANFAVLLPFAIFLQIKSNFLQILLDPWRAGKIAQIKYHNFGHLGTPGKFSLILLPAILLFFKKQRALVFLAAAFMLLVLTLIPRISFSLSRIFGFIFTNRIFGSVTWHYLILALSAGFLIMLIDRIASALSRPWRWLVNLAAMVGVALLVWAQSRFQTAAKAWEWLYSDGLDDWMIAHFWWVVSGLLLVVLILLALQFLRPKIAEFFAFKEPKNGLIALSGIIAITVIMFGTTYSYGWDYVKMTFHRPYFFQPATSVDFQNGDNNYKNTIKSMGGEEVANFIKNNIKPKSVFLVPGGLVYTFPTIVDQYMVDYPRSKVLLKTQEIYSPKKQIGLDEAISRLKEAKTQYILLNDAPDQNESFFDRYPDHFEKILKGDAVIYKVIP